MKKFFLGLAMLSMTSLLLTACNKGGEEKVEVDASTDSSVVEPEKTEEAAVETVTVEGDDGLEVKVEGEAVAE